MSRIRKARAELSCSRLPHRSFAPGGGKPCGDQRRTATARIAKSLGPSQRARTFLGLLFSQWSLGLGVRGQMHPPTSLSSIQTAKQREVAWLGISGHVARRAVTCLCKSVFFFSRKHGEGFFRWVHGSYHHESHCKELSSSESLRRVIIIIMRVIERRDIAQIHRTESHLRGAMLVRLTGKEQRS